MRIPFGYDVVGYDYVRDDEAMEVLYEAIKLVKEDGYSLRDAADYVVIKSSRPLSHEGLRKMIKIIDDGKELPTIKRNTYLNVMDDDVGC